MDHVSELNLIGKHDKKPSYRRETARQLCKCACLSRLASWSCNNTAIRTSKSHIDAIS